MRVTPSFPVAHRAGRLLASQRQAPTDGDPHPRCLQTSRSKPPAGPPATPILTRHSAADSVSQAGGDEGGHAVSLAPIPVLPVGPGGPTAQRPHRRRRAGVGHRAAASSAAEGVNLTCAGSCLARLLPITASFLPKRPTVINNMSQQLPVSCAGTFRVRLRAAAARNVLGAAGVLRAERRGSRCPRAST